MARAFDRLLRGFNESRRAQRFSASTEVNATTALRHFFEYLERRRVRDIRRVTEAHIAAYARRLRTIKSARRRPFALSTIAMRLWIVRTFFSYLVDTRVLLRTPAAELALPKNYKLPHNVLSEKDAERIVSAPPTWTNLGRRDRAILELLYGAGLRVAECCRLDVGDVDLRSGRVLVRDGKGRRDRVVPITGRAALAIDVYLRESRANLVRDTREPALFIARRYGTRATVGVIKTMVWKLGYDLRLTRRIGPHALRHACATHLLRRGADVRHVQQILGHKRLQTTAIYTHVAIKDLRDVVARSHPRDKRK